MVAHPNKHQLTYHHYSPLIDFTFNIHTVIAAAAVPRLDLFISLVGALASSCLAVIFPAIIQLCAFWNCDQPSGGNSDRIGEEKFKSLGQFVRFVKSRVGWHLFALKNFLLIIFGILGMFTGGWITISQLEAG